VVVVDKDVVFAFFEPFANEGPVVIVLLPMLDHLSATSSFKWQNPRTKPKLNQATWSSKHTSKKITQLQEFKPQAKSFRTLQALMEMKI